MNDDDAEAIDLADADVIESTEGAPGVPLSFKVYTLAELERRTDSPEALERAALAAGAARRRQQWHAAWTSLRGLGSAASGWLRTRNELGMRSDPKAVLREPFQRVGVDVRSALGTVDWKRHGITAGIVAAASFAFLFLVLVAAELTDDLRPGRGSHLASADAAEVTAPRTTIVMPSFAPATNMAALGMQPVSAGAAVVVEAEADEPAPLPVPKRAAAKKGKGTTKGKLTFRNADAVFNP